MSGQVPKKPELRLNADEIASYTRLAELRDTPIRGDFDAAHLNAIHAFIFQDSPQHRPGQNRPDTTSWVKNRTLEGERTAYSVPYVSQDVAGHLERRLAAFEGPASLRGLGVRAFAERLGELYSDLDRIHPWSEGNSRTLRAVTRLIAEEAGFRLNWTPSGVDASTRNQLYLARDVAVMERRWPGLDEARAMATDDREEYESWYTLTDLRQRMSVRVTDIIEAGTTPLAPAPEGTRSLSHLADMLGGRQETSHAPASPGWLEKAVGYRPRPHQQQADEAAPSAPAQPGKGPSYDPSP